MLELMLLGRFEMRLGGALVLLPSRPAQSLLAYLALNAGTAHRREKLAGLLWPDADEANARSNLRHALWRIRKAIETDETATPYLLTDELAVSFNAGADYSLDCAVLVRNGESLQDQLATVAVYRGELLPGFYDDWVTLERERLEAVFQHKMQRLLDRLVEEHRWPEALEWGERWVALGHAPEPGYRALMLAHAVLGNRSGVAQVYQRCREALFTDLGVEPSPATRRLYERLRQDAPDPPVTADHAPSADDSPAPGVPPYRGLLSYDEADADSFFGRERLTAQLLSRLRTEPFLAVIGASGSGKSSLVRAGLVPALRHAHAGERTPWAASQGPSFEVHVLTPTAHPLDALVMSVIPNSETAAARVDRVRLLDELGRDPHGLQRMLQEQRRRLVLVIDQFEELFTSCRDSFEREAFAENLVVAAGAEGPARVVIALRADFYAHCAEFPALREAIALHQEYVGPLSAAELRRAIEGPATQGGWELEPGLVNVLLHDVGEEPGALPLLSHALLETWQRRHGRRLTVGGYVAAGGVHGAIAQTAETVFTQQLATQQQTIARRVFLHLTELGEGTQDTRRRATIADLVPRPEAEVEVREVLAILAGARLVTLGTTTAEVAHEALIREWPRLREWLDQDREALRVQRQLTSAAQEWERLGRDASGLYRGARLAQALAWVAERNDELGSLECGFLEASQLAAQHEAAEHEAQRERELVAARQLADAEQQRAETERRSAAEQRRTAGQLRVRAVLLGVACAIAFVLAGTAAFFGDAARQQASRAQAEARAAVSRELAAAALTNLSIDPERAALLALRGLDVTYTVDRTWTREVEDALHRVLPLLRTELTLIGHSARVLSVAFSPDGRRVATASEDGTARLWDATTGREQSTLQGHAGAVNAVAFRPDGQLVATASDDRTIGLWDAMTGQQRLALTGHTREVERLAFSPDGTRLATSSLDGTVALWDALSGRKLLAFTPDRAGDIALPLDVAFSPDGERLATAIPGGAIGEWDLSTEPPRLLHTWVTSQYGSIARSVGFSPDGTRVAATTDTGAQLWWAGTGEPALSIVGHAIQISHMAFSPDGTRLATASVDQTARIWDARSGRELLSLAGHQATIGQVAFSPDSRRLATASWDGTAKVWGLGAARELLTLATPGTLGWYPARLADGPLLGQHAMSQDGSRLLAGLWDGTARVWNTRSGDEVLTLRGHRSQVWGAAISPQGRRYATGSADRTVRLWDAMTGDVLWTGSGHADRVVAVAFNPDGTRLASASDDTTARVWDVDTGSELFQLTGHRAGLTSIAFSPDGTRLVTASESGHDGVRVWDAQTGALLRTLEGHEDAVWSVAWSSDGGRLVTASRDGTARIWDVSTAQVLLTIHSHGGTLIGAALSPDGRQIATGSRDGTTQLWDALTGEELLVLGGADIGDGVDAVAFDSDGRRLVIRKDQSVRTYILPIQDLRAVVQSRLTRTWTPDECQRFLHLDRCPDTDQPVGSNADRLASVAAVNDPTTPPVTRFARTPALRVPAPSLSSAPGLVGTLKIVSSLPRTGSARHQTDTIINAFVMALEEHNYEVGKATLVLEDLDDATAVKGFWDAPTEAANANRAVNDPEVMMYLGPYTSGAARVSIPITCAANLAMISPSNTYAGLTKRTPYNSSDEPDLYYQNCARNYVRVAATDDLQGAVGAQFARQLGASRVYVLHDSELYGQGVAEVFADTSRRLGLQVVGGPEGMDPAASDYRLLAERIREADPDLVYFGGGGADSRAGKLWKDLRSTLGGAVTLMGPDGINDASFIDAAGAAAEGTYATFPGVPASKLTGKGAEWYRRYKQQFQGEPEPYAAYGYEAMNVALTAIEKAGVMDRSRIRDALFATRDYAGVLGTWSFTTGGDTTLTRMSVRQVRNGRWDDSTVQVVEVTR